MINVDDINGVDAEVVHSRRNLLKFVNNMHVVHWHFDSDASKRHLNGNAGGNI